MYVRSERRAGRALRCDKHRASGTRKKKWAERWAHRWAPLKRLLIFFIDTSVSTEIDPTSPNQPPLGVFWTVSWMRNAIASYRNIDSRCIGRSACTVPYWASCGCCCWLKIKNICDDIVFIRFIAVLVPKLDNDETICIVYNILCGGERSDWKYNRFVFPFNQSFGYRYYRRIESMVEAKSLGEELPSS